MEEVNMVQHPSNSSCFICLEKLKLESSSSSSTSLKSRQEICVQFSTSVSKFIQMNKKLDIDISQLNTLTFNQGNEDSSDTVEKELQMCCENCFEPLQQFCKNYAQLQNLHKELLQIIYGIFLKKKTEPHKVLANDDDVNSAAENDSHFADDDYGHHDEDARNEITVLKVLERPSSSSQNLKDNFTHRQPPPNILIRRRGLRYKRGGDSVRTKFDFDFGVMATFEKWDTFYYPCLICRKWLPNQPSLLEHMRRHTREHVYHCQVCQFEFQCKKNLKSHQIARHTVTTNPKLRKTQLPVTCDICQTSFDSTWALNRHLMIDHKMPKTFICKEQNCGEKFFNLHTLLRHQKIHENPPDNPRPFNCDLCPKKFTLRVNLTHHKRKVHRKPKPMKLQCDLCQLTFDKIFYLNRHLINDHKIEKKFTCRQPNCGESFFTRPSLLRHRRTHLNPPDDPKPHKCHLCPSKFKFQEELSAHKIRVHGDKSITRKHLCDLCGKRFLQHSQLRTHQHLVHNPEKPQKVKVTYKCDFEGCGKIFHQKYKFEDHALTHTKERNHQCEHCGESFKQERNLKRHILQKHPQVPVFQCKDCAESFHTFPQLRQHRKLIHPYIRSKRPSER